MKMTNLNCVENRAREVGVFIKVKVEKKN